MFRPKIYLEPPHVLSPKPWFQLWPTLNFLKFMHLQSQQCDETVDLLILMVLLNGRFRYILSILRNRSSLPKSMVVIYFMMWAPTVSNLKPYFSLYVNISESMICGHLSFSINDFASNLGI
jgi:hypothetical protein